MAASANKNAESSELRRRDLAELAALADGTLDAGRRAAMQARADGSSELRELYSGSGAWWTSYIVRWWRCTHPRRCEPDSLVPPGSVAASGSALSMAAGLSRRWL